jgi:hypothetical protein
MKLNKHEQVGGDLTTEHRYKTSGSDEDLGWRRPDGQAASSQARAVVVAPRCQRLVTLRRTQPAALRRGRQQRHAGALEDSGMWWRAAVACCGGW